MQSNHIGKIFRFFRKSKNLTIETVAARCDMSVRGYEKIELGDANPKWTTIQKISAGLDLNITIMSTDPESNVGMAIMDTVHLQENLR